MADVTITLDARNSAASRNPGFAPAVLFGGTGTQSYCYKFSGGTGSGNVTVVKDGKKKTIEISLIADTSYYRINQVLIGNDPENQLKVKSLDATSATIEDKNDELESDAYYCVVLEDISSGAEGVLIGCDPRISNVPE